jgi:alcohol dehydrogenase class IV
LANALMIPYAMQFNAPTVAERLARLAAVVGAEPTATGFIDWLNALNADIGIPAQLSAVGVTAEKLDHLVAIAYADGCHALNSRSCSAEDIRHIYTTAL